MKGEMIIMKKRKVTVFAALVVSLVLMCFSATAFAATLSVVEPDGSVYYRGEKIPVQVKCTDNPETPLEGDGHLWEYLINSKKKAVWEKHQMPFIDSVEEYTYTGKINTAKLKAGKYTFKTELWWLDSDLEAKVNLPITLKNLKAPASFKVKTGKKKVKLVFKEVKGATKYQIYRSKKQKSGFKKIGTTIEAKYYDKKVKKGKRYYYKVRAVRNKGFGPVKGKFTKAVRSKKVK